MIATAVSAGNDCFFCMDSHAAHATALIERDGDVDSIALLDTIKLGSSDGFDPKMQALLHDRADRATRPSGADGAQTRTLPAPPAPLTRTSSWPCSSPRPSRCTTGSSTASGRAHPPTSMCTAQRAGEIADRLQRPRRLRSLSR